MATAQLIRAPLEVAGGQLFRFEDFSSNYVTKRNIDIWLPEKYQDLGPLDVLYMHDGQMLFDSNSTWNGQEWKVDETLSRLIGDKEIRPCLVVGIWNTEFRHSEYFPQKPFESLDSAFRRKMSDENDRLFRIPVCSDDYLRFIVTELKPFIDSTYHTNRGQENTFIMGSSMGGLISMYAICEYPEIFGGAACLSTHWVGTFNPDNNPIPDAFVDYLQDNLPAQAEHRLYFDYGTETLDSMYEPFQRQVDVVLSIGGYDDAKWKTVKYEGAPHTENAWAKRFHGPVRFLLGIRQ